MEKEANGKKALLIEGARRAFSENEISNQQLYKAIMNGHLSLNEGMLYENMIAQTKAKTGFKIFPIEVKPSKNYTTTSLIKFKD